MVGLTTLEDRISSSDGNTIKRGSAPFLPAKTQCLIGISLLMKEELPGFPELHTNTEEHVDPRSLRKPELLKRVIKGERDSKRLRKWLKTTKELLDEETNKTAELKKAAKEREEANIKWSIQQGDRRRYLLEEIENLKEDRRKERERNSVQREKMREEIEREQSFNKKLTDLLEPIFAPQIEEQAEVIRGLEEKLTSLRSVLGDDQ